MVSVVRPLGDRTHRHLLHPLDLDRLGRHVRTRAVDSVRLSKRLRVRYGTGRTGLPGVDVSLEVRAMRES